ncbi:MAG: hypothetical protein ACK5OX_05625 [Desertimonas sp.]
MSRTRHLLLTTATTAVAAGAVMLGGHADASSPPSTPDTAGAEMEPAADQLAADATPTVIVDESGTPIAQVTILGIDPDWQDFGDFDEPSSDSQYVQVLVRIESLSPRGLFQVQDRDFSLQDADGFLFAADVVPTAAQRDGDEDVVDDAELAVGEAIELPLTFEVVAGVAPDTLYYFPNPRRLVTLTELVVDGAAAPSPVPPTTTTAQG